MSNGSADVSVIIAAYNAEASLPRALASVAAQTLPPTEVVVVDDGSADGTFAAAEACRESLRPCELVLVRQENKGAGAARNRALALATAKYVAFLDADDEWLPEKLSRSLAVLREGAFDLVAHDYLTDVDGAEVHVDCHQHFMNATDPYAELYVRGYIPSISVVARRDDVLRAGGFDESLRNAQDFELWLALLQTPERRFTVFGEALARYHHTAGSLMTQTARRLDCCTIIAQRYYPVLRARGSAALRKLWLRILVIYMEAVHADPGRRFRYLAAAAGALVRATAHVLFGSDRPASRLGLIDGAPR